MKIGEKIRNMRKEKLLTQQELADRCELSKGFISQIENEVASPSISTLENILTSLGSDLKSFFNNNENLNIVYKEKDYTEKIDLEKKISFKWLVNNAQRNLMEPTLLTLYEDGKYEDFEPHEGEEFGYVLDGKVLVKLSDKKYEVKTGESFYYKANESHEIINLNNDDSLILFVSSPPYF